MHTTGAICLLQKELFVVYVINATRDILGAESVKEARDAQEEGMLRRHIPQSCHQLGFVIVACVFFYAAFRVAFPSAGPER